LGGVGPKIDEQIPETSHVSPVLKESPRKERLSAGRATGS